MNDKDPHTLTPSTASATITQTDLTITLRPASRALPAAWVAWHVPPYKRPCPWPIPKAMAPKTSTASTESITHIKVKGRRNATGTLTANSSGVTLASTNAIASSGSQGFRSNHICAHVADEVGHG